MSSHEAYGLAKAMETMALLRAEQLAAAGLQDIPCTEFHCTQAPRINACRYVLRFAKTKCSSACYVACLVYIDRLGKSYPALAVSSLTCHRLIATALLLAIKHHDDDIFRNSIYARCAGLSTAELNALEARMLKLLGYRLFISLEEFCKYERIVLAFVGQEPPRTS